MRDHSNNLRSATHERGDILEHNKRRFRNVLTLSVRATSGWMEPLRAKPSNPVPPKVGQN
jgi:hypothetical protein